MVREENGHNYDEKTSLLISLILSFILFSFYFISILLAFCSLVMEDEKGVFLFLKSFYFKPSISTVT